MMGTILNFLRQILGAVLYLLCDFIDIRDAGVRPKPVRNVKLNPFGNKVGYKTLPWIITLTYVIPIFFTIDQTFFIAQELINLVTNITITITNNSANQEKPSSFYIDNSLVTVKSLIVW